MKKNNTESAGWKWSILFIMALMSILVIKDIKEGAVTVEALTLITNEISQSVQLFGLIFGILIIVVLLMLIILPNKESLVRSSSPYKKEHKVFEAGVKNEKAKEVNLVLLKMIVKVIIGLMMIILSPKLIEWLINI